MNRFLLTYDLVGADASWLNYRLLIDRIREYADPVHVQDSVWLIKTNWTAQETFTDLKRYLHPADRLYVMTANGMGVVDNSLDGDPAVQAFFSS